MDDRFDARGTSLWFRDCIKNVCELGGFASSLALGRIAEEVRLVREATHVAVCRTPVIGGGEWGQPLERHRRTLAKGDGIEVIQTRRIGVCDRPADRLRHNGPDACASATRRNDLPRRQVGLGQYPVERLSLPG
jgi:hypothetical protein